MNKKNKLEGLDSFVDAAVGCQNKQIVSGRHRKHKVAVEGSHLTVNLSDRRTM